MISLIGLVLIVGFLVVVVIVGIRGLSALIGLISSMRKGNATLTCPQCQQETTLVNQVCQLCGHDL